MVIVINGEGYEALRSEYDGGRLMENSEIMVGLNVRGFWIKLRERFFKFECYLRGSIYCGQENLSCYFDDRDVLCLSDSGKEVGGELEKSFGNWGAMAAD